MKKAVLVSFLILSTFMSAEACLNLYYGEDKHGHFHPIDRYQFESKLNKNFNLKLMESKLIKLESKIREKGDYMDLSDYAVYLMKIGKVEESLAILVELYWAHPDEYKLASNLGTAYELNGEVDSALVYINRGMELNSRAHEGSEWVHIRVLETKKELAIDSAYLESHSVLQLTDQEKLDTAVRDQIWIQVTERFPFSPGPDAIMASIMVDMGDCFLETSSVGYAQAFYKIARDYYGDETEGLLAKINETSGIMPDSKINDPKFRDRPPVHAMHWVVGKTSAERMMDDNNEDDYQVQWEKINLDVDSLLSFVGLSVIDRSVPEEIQEDEGGYSLTGPLKDGQQSDKSLLWILLGGGVVVMIGMFFFLRKR